MELSSGLAPSLRPKSRSPPKDERFHTPHPAGTRFLSDSQAPGLKVSSLPTRSHARLVLFVPAQSRLAGAGPEADCQVCGSCSGVCGTQPSTQPRPPSACALLRAMLGPPLCPELKSLGALRVNDGAVPFSPGTGRKPSQGGWCQGSPHPRWCCSVVSQAGGGCGAVIAWCCPQERAGWGQL